MSHQRRRRAIVAGLTALVAAALTLGLWTSLVRNPTYIPERQGLVVLTDGTRFAIADERELGPPPVDRLRSIFGDTTVWTSPLGSVFPHQHTTVTTFPGAALLGNALWTRRSISLGAYIRTPQRTYDFASDPDLWVTDDGLTGADRDAVLAAFADYLEIRWPDLDWHDAVRRGTFSTTDCHAAGLAAIGTLGLLWLAAIALLASLVPWRRRSARVPVPPAPG